MKQFVLQTDDLDLQAQACAAGIGLAYGPRWVFQNGLREGRLTTVTVKDLGEQEAPICLLRNPGTPTAAIEIFSKFLRAKLAKVMF